MVSATQGALQIAQHGIYPIEFRLLHGGALTATDDPVMRAPGLGHGIKARETVGDHRATRSQMLLSPGLDFR
jgi:hypothetical protein